MTVQELRDLLADEDGSRVVILSRDAEGNGYQKLRVAYTGCVEELEWHIEGVYLEELTDDDRKAGYTHEDVRTDGVPVLVLTP